MDTTTAFHSRFPTDVDQEICLAENLYIAARMRFGDQLSKLVRGDPADLWRRFHFCRVGCHDSPVPFAIVVQGLDFAPGSKASNDDILTPSVPAWREFVDRLVGELSSPDAAWRFAPASRCHCGTSGLEFWPLASAQLVRSLGFAIGETLAVFLAFYARSDRDVLDHVEDVWNRVRPRRRRTSSNTQRRQPRG
jgi:hypothetical protein